MKRLALIALFACAPAVAQTPLCGIPPFPPFGCYYTCVCSGWSCAWELICDGD